MTRTRLPRSPLTACGRHAGDNGCRGYAVQQRSLIPRLSLCQALSCGNLQKSDPIFMQPIAITARGNDGLAFAASRKPTWCLDLRFIAWLTDKRIRTVPLRRIGAFSSSSTTRHLKRYNQSATRTAGNRRGNPGIRFRQSRFFSRGSRAGKKNCLRCVMSDPNENRCQFVIENAVLSHKTSFS